MSQEMIDSPLCIIQARMGSTRLPGKVLLRVQGVPLLEYEIERIKQAKNIAKIVIATTKNKEDDAIESLCRHLNIDVFRGSAEDVLDRYVQCARAFPSYSSIVRLTGDCCLIDPTVIDDVVALFQSGSYDFASNTLEPTFPDGMDVEVFSKDALEEAGENARLQSEREHVTPYIFQHTNFKKANRKAPVDFSSVRLTVDMPEDFEVIQFIIEHSKSTDSYLHYISLFTKYPHILLKNMHVGRNEGYLQSLEKDKPIR